MVYLSIKKQTQQLPVVFNSAVFIAYLVKNIISLLALNRERKDRYITNNQKEGQIQQNVYISVTAFLKIV